ncbi:MAG: hypothetical protein V1752_04335, partial [Candidatus Firestonebacteria bacterium]
IILCWNYIGETWLAPAAGINLHGWLVLLILTSLHFLEDEWRAWTIQKLNSPDSLFFFLWDQFIHIALIFVFFPDQINLHPEKWVLLAILFVLTTHFSAILIYFIEKEVFGYSRLLTQEKYYSMGERLVTSLSLLLPGWWALSFFMLWLVRIVVHWTKSDREFSVINIVAGTLLAVLFGLLARLLIY